MFANFTYQKLDYLNRSLLGFILTPLIISYIIMSKSVKKQLLSKFEKEFFKILLQKSLLKFLIICSVIVSILVLIDKNLLLLNTFLLVVNLSIIIFTIGAIKQKVTVLFELSLHKDKLILS